LHRALRERNAKRSIGISVVSVPYVMYLSIHRVLSLDSLSQDTA